MKRESERIATDSAAQRLLNLAFIFNTATRPLATNEIISDTDLGYGSSNRDSDFKKFARDRQKLAEQGIEIVSSSRGITAENEETYWELDRDQTFAAGGIITVDDAVILAEAIDEYLSGPLTPLKIPLTHVRLKVLELTGATPPHHPEADEYVSDARQAMLDAIWFAFSLHRTLTFSYTNARGEQSRRQLKIYGIFTHAGETYVVGLDSKSGAIRTFRADRMDRALRPGASYEVPPSFDIHEYLLLPLGYGSEESVPATFTFPADRSPADVSAITQGRGTLSRGAEGLWMWEISVRSIDAAASFCLSHARDGMRPARPEHLVSAWNEQIEKAVANHVA